MPPALPAPTPSVPDDLGDRWRRARLAALRAIATDAPADLDEPALASLAWTTDPDRALGAVFDNSYRLGRSFRAWARADLTLPDLAALLPRLGAPCAAEGFDRVGVEARSGRAPCTLATSPGACALWREALYGLVSGLSSSVRFTRVDNPESGGACVDLLHVDAESPFRMGPIPEDLRPALDDVAARVGRVVKGATVEFLGFQEGALCVRTHTAGPKCGLDADHLLLGFLRRALPDLPVRSSNPRAVLDGR